MTIFVTNFLNLLLSYQIRWIYYFYTKFAELTIFITHLLYLPFYTKVAYFNIFGIKYFENLLFSYYFAEFNIFIPNLLNLLQNFHIKFAEYTIFILFWWINSQFSITNFINLSFYTKVADFNIFGIKDFENLVFSYYFAELTIFILNLLNLLCSYQICWLEFFHTCWIYYYRIKFAEFAIYIPNLLILQFLYKICWID